jgi:hypothetical protein
MTELDKQANAEQLNDLSALYLSKMNYMTSHQERFCGKLLRFGCTIRLLNEWIVKINNIVIPKGFK